MADIKDKIRKLLALATSNNEHEAKDALCMAKKLMAKYKLEEIDLGEVKSKDVKEMNSDLTCSKRREAWMVNLATNVADNFCCKSILRRQYDKQTSKIYFIGLEEDVEVCTTIYKYAVSCVRAGIDELKKQYIGYDREYRKSIFDGYGFGFAKGVKLAFEQQKQQDETGWGLVMVTPQEVTDAIKNFKTVSYRGSAENKMSRSSYRNGYEDGTKFDPAHRLQGGAKAGALRISNVG